MAYGKSIVHFTGDVAWPWKFKVVTPVYFSPIISEMTGETDSVRMEHVEVAHCNGWWAVGGIAADGQHWGQAALCAYVIGFTLWALF